jgi:hypothetical protein
MLDDPIRHSWRDEWFFEYASTELESAAQKKVDHHRKRLEHWEGEHQSLREKYIASVQESAKNATEKEAREAEDWANALMYADAESAGGAQFRMASMSGLPQPKRKEIMGDPEIYAELQKALGKVQEHKGRIETFSRWVQLFKRDKDNVRRLTYSDAVFFGV